jgi:hypothetical protein
MEGIEKLQAEVLEMNNYNISAIFNYLKTRKELYEKFNNEEKSIKQMYEFICERARKQVKDNVAMIDDRVVYLWAVTYFNKSNEELELNKKTKPTTKPTEKNKDDNKTNEKIEEKQKEIKPEDNQITLFQEVQK